MKHWCLLNIYWLNLIWIMFSGFINASLRSALSGNFSVTHLYSTTARLQWSFNLSSDVTGYEILVRSVTQPRFKHYSIGLVNSEAASDNYRVTLLTPDTEYEVFIYALSDGSVTGASQAILFRTLPSEEDPTYERLLAEPIELVIVLSIVAAWAIAFGFFLRKWGTIRILQPRDYRWKHTPKNLETIKIVKRPNDSVIYRNYSQKLTTTMIERERKFERLNTMPNLSLAHKPVLAEEYGVSALLHGFKSTTGKTNRFRDTFLKSAVSISPPAKRRLSTTSQSKTDIAMLLDKETLMSNPTNEDDNESCLEENSEDDATCLCDDLKSAHQDFMMNTCGIQDERAARETRPSETEMIRFDVEGTETEVSVIANAGPNG